MLRQFLLTCSAAAAMAGSALAQDIVIGFPGPVTGPLAFIGEHMKWGAELAVDEINAKGGVLGGKKLAFIQQDSQCRPADAVSAVEKMVSQDRVTVLMGDVCSGATLAVMPIAEREKIPMLVTISTHPDITGKAGVGGNQWVFRSNPTDAIIGETVAKVVVEEGFKRVVIVGEDTDYGRGGVASTKTGLGGKVEILSEDFFPANETEFLSVLTRIRSQKPDAILYYLLDQQTLNFMKQYVQFGLNIPLVGRPPLGSKVVADMIKTGKFSGSWTVYPYFDSYEGAENQALVKSYVARYGQPPHYAGFEVYEGVKIIAAAIEKAGSAEPEKIRDALKTLRYNSILGTVAFDDHHQAQNAIMKIAVEGDKLRVTDVVGQ